MIRREGGLFSDEPEIGSFARLAALLFPGVEMPEGRVPSELEIETRSCLARMIPLGADAEGRDFVGVRVTFKLPTDVDEFATVDALRLMIRLHAGRPRGGENWEFGIDAAGTPFFGAEFAAADMSRQHFDTVMAAGIDHAELVLRMVRMANGGGAEDVPDLLHFRG